jgi:YD repeat-containing protein
MTWGRALAWAIAAVGSGQPVAAQTFGSSIQAYVSPPAEKLAVTPGGVDIRTGRYAHHETDLSIGGESGGLALTRTMGLGVKGHIEPFANFSHNWEILLTERRVDIARGNYDQGGGQDFRISVRFGGRADTFDSLSTNTSTTFGSASSSATISYTGSRTSSSVAYSYLAPDGTQVTFRPLGNSECSSEIYTRCAYASDVTEPDGTKYSLGYDSVPGTANMTRLRSVVSSRGFALLLEYGASAWNFPSKACLLNLAQRTKPADNVCPANAAASASYSYGGVGGAPKLATATDAGGATWSYTYSGTAGTYDMGFVKPGQSAAWLVNTIAFGANEEQAPVEIVQYQRFADGNFFGYSYHDSSAETAGTISMLAGAQYSVPDGGVDIHYAFPRRPITLNPPRWEADGTQIDNFGDAYYQVTPGPATITDTLGRTTSYDYCDRYMAQSLPASEHYRCLISNLQSYTDPEGIKTELDYDGSHNVLQVRRHPKPGSSLSDIVTSATYICTYRNSCAKPVTVTDGRGKVSRYTYAPEHGGVLSETGPAVNGVTPQKRYSYQQRYAWISNGAGGYVQAASPVWLLTQTSLCKAGNPAGSGAGCANGASDEVVTAYDYGPDAGPNTLLLRGISVTADGQTLRTCYGYDAMARRISETKPRAGLAVCP